VTTTKTHEELIAAAVTRLEGDLSIEAQRDAAQHEASEALCSLRDAVERGREALAAVADLEHEKPHAPSPSA
jgi:hypothetical protein